jgi:hypothetical protein
VTPVNKSVPVVTFAGGIVSPQKPVLDHVSQCVLDIIGILLAEGKMHKNVQDACKPMRCTPVACTVPLIH